MPVVVYLVCVSFRPTLQPFEALQHLGGLPATSPLSLLQIAGGGLDYFTGRGRLLHLSAVLNAVVLVLATADMTIRCDSFQWLFFPESRPELAYFTVCWCHLACATALDAFWRR